MTNESTLTNRDLRILSTIYGATTKELDAAFNTGVFNDTVVGYIVYALNDIEFLPEGEILRSLRRALREHTAGEARTMGKTIK